MSSMARTLVLLVGIVVVSSRAGAEPLVAAKQSTRCTACHYSPTGGGLLTPYGRLLSHRELSTTGGETAPDPLLTAAWGVEGFTVDGLGAVVVRDIAGALHYTVDLSVSTTVDF